ncbi:unnamed protein product [Cochlearia groenlandica]
MDFQTIQPTLWKMLHLHKLLKRIIFVGLNLQIPTFSLLIFLIIIFFGLRKEEIKVEIEDSTYLIVRTESKERSPDKPVMKSFKRKFRLPESVDIIGISASYEDDVLTVVVPNMILTRTSFFIDPSDIPETLQVLARAA